MVVTMTLLFHAVGCIVVSSMLTGGCLLYYASCQCQYARAFIDALRIEVIVDLIEGWCCCCRCFIVGTVAVLLLLLLSKVPDDCDISLHCAV